MEYNCPNCGAVIRYLAVEKNVRNCPCCGKPRPFPTEPGEWEYMENPTMPPEYQKWVRVTIKLPEPNDRDGQEGLRIWKDGKMIWWPDSAAWRKVE
jgi:hypothetical protein